MRHQPGSSFWDFSLAFYGTPGVAEACLELQERCGVDVNVLLYLLYLALRRRRIGAAEVAQIDGLASPWREAVVVPLRGVRRVLKAPIGAFAPEAGAALRSEVKRIELAAERLQQETLERLLAPDALGIACDDCAACARAHLECYGTCMGGSLGEPKDRLLERFEAFAARSRAGPPAPGSRRPGG